MSLELFTYVTKFIDSFEGNGRTDVSYQHRVPHPLAQVDGTKNSISNRRYQVNCEWEWLNVWLKLLIKHILFTLGDLLKQYGTD